MLSLSRNDYNVRIKQFIIYDACCLFTRPVPVPSFSSRTSCKQIVASVMKNRTSASPPTWSYRSAGPWPTDALGIRRGQSSGPRDVRARLIYNHPPWAPLAVVVTERVDEWKQSKAARRLNSFRGPKTHTQTDTPGDAESSDSVGGTRCNNVVVLCTRRDRTDSAGDPSIV